MEKYFAAGINVSCNDDKHLQGHGQNVKYFTDLNKYAMLQHFMSKHDFGPCGLNAEGTNNDNNGFIVTSFSFQFQKKKQSSSRAEDRILVFCRCSCGCSWLSHFKNKEVGSTSIELHGF